MKKILIAAACVGCLASANAQDVIERPTFADNWSIGLDAGVTTPLKGHSFFGNMRGNFGLHVDKQISPLFGIGAEAAWGVNTSTVNGGLRSKTTHTLEAMEPLISTMFSAASNANRHL